MTSDISLHTTYCNLAYSLTIGQRSLLANLVQQIINHKQQISEYASTTIPTTVKDIRSTYIDRMIPNLPKPEIKFDEHHTFVSVLDVLKLVFSFGYRCQPIQKNLTRDREGPVIKGLELKLKPSSD